MYRSSESSQGYCCAVNPSGLRSGLNINFPASSGHGKVGASKGARAKGAHLDVDGLLRWHWHRDVPLRPLDARCGQLPGKAVPAGRQSQSLFTYSYGHHFEPYDD